MLIHCMLAADGAVRELPEIELTVTTFWDRTPFSVVGRLRRAFSLSPEVSPNFGTHISDYTMSHYKTP